MNSFVKILSLALEKYFHFHYLEYNDAPSYQAKKAGVFASF